MYLQELLEDQSLQQNGARFYPSTESNSYILVRRSGTIASSQAMKKVLKKFPPKEFISPNELDQHNTEISRHFMVDYLIADMSEMLNSETGEEIKYNKAIGAKILFGEQSIDLMNRAFAFSNAYENYSLVRCKDAIDDINAHIKKFCFGDLKDELARKQLYNMSPDAYEQHMTGVKDSNKEILNAFFDLCRERKDDGFLTHSSICEAVTLNIIETQFDDAVYIIKQIDDNFIKLKRKQDADAIERQRDN